MAIAAVVLINAGIGYYTEDYAERTIRALTRTTPGQALVLRDGEPVQLPREQVVPGDVLVLYTDGIWEAQSPAGDMFGKAHFKDIVRQHADRPAKDIVQAVIQAVDRFCHPLAKTDDVTLVVAKIICIT